MEPSVAVSGYDGVELERVLNGMFSRFWTNQLPFMAEIVHTGVFGYS